MANSAFSFSQYTNSDSQGWKSSRNGYLSESEHIYALAIFNELKGIPAELASGHLKPHLKRLLKKAHKELDSSGIAEELRAVAFVAPTNVANKSNE